MCAYGLLILFSVRERLKSIWGLSCIPRHSSWECQHMNGWYPASGRRVQDYARDLVRYFERVVKAKSNPLKIDIFASENEGDTAKITWLPCLIFSIWEWSLTSDILLCSPFDQKHFACIVISELPRSKMSKLSLLTRGCFLIAERITWLVCSLLLSNFIGESLSRTYAWRCRRIFQRTLSRASGIYERVFCFTGSEISLFVRSCSE